jgi:hypothetical protein
VPTETGVRVDGPPPEPGPAGSGGEPDLPEGPDDASNEEELVAFFLQAAATDPEDPVEGLRDFLHPDVRDDWEPEERVYVARVEDDPSVTRGDQVRVEVRVRRVGTLGEDGIFEPRLAQEDEVLRYFVTTEREQRDEAAPAASQPRYRISDLPPFIVLDDQALERHFEQRPIYFWDDHHELLVPDLRWLPQALTQPRRSQAVVDWLVAGPAPWLSGVESIPEGIALDGNVVPGEGSLEVRLTPPHDDEDLSQLDAQLWWTLRPDLLPGDVAVTLLIGDEERRLDGDYRSENPVPADPPASFAVLDGAINQHAPVASVDITALDNGLNTDIVRAAVPRDPWRAALVRPEPTGELRLSLAERGQVTDTPLVAEDIGHPVWLNNPSGTGLVVADEQLYQFSMADGEVAVNKVDLPDITGAVTAVAAAPDGRRLALIAGDRLYVASMSRAGGAAVSVSRRPPLPTAASNLDGVAFIREDWLAIVGTARGQSRLFELTVDGALERDLPDGDLGEPDDISSFVGYPGDPENPEDRGRIMFEAEDQVWRYTYGHEPAEIEAVDLRGEEPLDEAENPQPRAPFFLD